MWTLERHIAPSKCMHVHTQINKCNEDNKEWPGAVVLVAGLEGVDRAGFGRLRIAWST